MLLEIYAKISDIYLCNCQTSLGSKSSSDPKPQREKRNFKMKTKKLQYTFLLSRRKDLT